MSPAMLEWLIGRPAVVRDMAVKYPPGTVLNVHGRPAYVCSYLEQEDGQVGLSASFVNPAIDYERAIENRFTVCADCLGEGP